MKSGDRITVSGREAVVSVVHPDDEHRRDVVEVVYLDRGRPIYEDAHWRDGAWEFVVAGPCGGYAINVPRLAEFVRMLGVETAKPPRAPSGGHPPAARTMRRRP